MRKLSDKELEQATGGAGQGLSPDRPIAYTPPPVPYPPRGFPRDPCRGLSGRALGQCRPQPITYKTPYIKQR